jgi:hypothetical protein
MSPTQMHDAEILERIRELFRKWIEDEVSPGQVFDGLSILLKEPYKKPEEWSPPDIWWASKEQVDARVDEKVRDVVREILEEERSRRGEIWWEVPLDSPLWAGQRTDHGIEPTAASGRGVATDEYARQKLAENKRSLQLVGHRISLSPGRKVGRGDADPSTEGRWGDVGSWLRASEGGQANLGSRVGSQRPRLHEGVGS